MKTRRSEETGLSEERILLESRNLTLRFGGLEALNALSFSVPAQRIVAIIGPNGAGKTTLLSAILGLVPYRGEIRFCPCLEHGGGKPRVNYVPQQLDFDRGAPVTVLEFLCLSTQRRPLWFGPRKRARSEALRNLERVNAAHLAARPLGRLSGGEFQRVMLALALAPRPDLLLLDEPVSGVDAGGEELFCELLDKLRQEAGFTLVLISHDLQIVTRHADHVICLNRRVLGQGATSTTLTADVLAATFGIHLGLADLDAASNGRSRPRGRSLRPAPKRRPRRRPKSSMICSSRRRSSS
jgi:zinc transport system ATP-binding protein